MSSWFSRFWPVGQVDPIEYLDGPDDTPEADAAPEPVRLRAELTGPQLRRLRDGLEAWDPDGPPVQTVTDVEPEARPWDITRTPIDPMPADRERACIDEHSDRRCDGADAFTSWIGALKDLERRVAVLEQQVTDEMAKREPKEKQS